MNKIIRRATPTDASRIATIHVETWQSAYQGLIPSDCLDSLSIAKRYEKWQTKLNNVHDKTIYLVSLINEEVLGWASMCKCQDDDAKSYWGEVGALYVHPTAQKKGLGSLLMAEGMNILKQAGYTYATLWVLTSNVVARAFYESKGWRVEGRTKIDQRDGFDLHETRYIIKL
jgi:ribosomal protein S18 acetylase RimI-like enzyme